MTFDIVRAGPEHAKFIADTFLHSVVTAWPWSMVPWPALRDDLERRIRHPSARAAVAVEGSRKAWMGWAAVDPMANEVIYAYTLGPYRTKLKFEPRVATTLVTELGVDLTKPTRIRYWTPAAETLSKRSGYHLEPAR